MRYLWFMDIFNIYAILGISLMAYSAVMVGWWVFRDRQTKKDRPWIKKIEH